MSSIVSCGDIVLMLIACREIDDRVGLLLRAAPLDVTGDEITRPGHGFLCGWISLEFGNDNLVFEIVHLSINSYYD